ncbi:hypothetical protein SAMN03003324_03828 [Pedobacter antarcticus]|nr:hypothetical protein SAMN03003324_03828 [Pedobacter antarcticus]
MRAAFVCSNPSCRLMTIGPSDVDDEKFLYNGKIAHIYPASVGGPRDLSGITPEQRMHQDNALFLCGSCADLIDKNNGIDFPVSRLKKWKANHMGWVTKNLNKQLSGDAGIVINVKDSQVVGTQHNYYTNDVVSQADSIDKTTFLKLDEIADEEKLMGIFRSLKDYHRIWSSQEDILDAVIEYLKQTRNKFLAEEIALATSKFLIELEELTKIITSYFDSWPYTQHGPDYKSELMPKVRHWTGFKADSEEKQQCEEISAKLIELDKTIIPAYQTFRMAVKRRLYV